MARKKFLEQIADYYTQGRWANDLADIVFFFPNKRSAMFMRHYIQQRLKGGYALMPRFTTFSRFAARVSNLAEPSRFEMIFLLYKIYCEVVREMKPELESTAQFDRFVFWGDMILDDFDVIESSLADASKLYANLKGLKEIAADYLTDEQKEIIRRIWGETPMTQQFKDFWTHIEHEGDGSLSTRFLSLWEVLGEVYRRFTDELASNNMALSGTQMKEALRVLRDTSAEELSKTHYVFVGLGDVSNAEALIMSRLKEVGAADFFWDLQSPFFKDGDSTDTTNQAVRFLEGMMREYPMPRDFHLEEIGMPERIDIVGVASSVMQTKVVGDIVSRMELTPETAFDTSIVVTDPAQLVQLMISLPAQPHGLNVTLGMPYQNTTFAALFEAVVALQRRSRRRASGEREYFSTDVLEVLMHPHVQLIAPEDSRIIRQYIQDNNKFYVSADELTANFPTLDFIFRPISDSKGKDYLSDVDSSCAYVANLISSLKDALARQKGYEKSFEMEILDYFEDQVKEIKDLIEKYQIRMDDSTFLSMFERIMRSKSINLEGTPLKGVQVMGVLETRCLDFDTIIFPAMNERVLPRKEYVRTMIPNSLRYGYGLPSVEHTESFYSYYFFRAISRAGNVTLIYDTRSPGRGRGEMSRYLEQLLYTFNRGNVGHRIIDLSGEVTPPREIVVNKTPKVLQKLQRFKEPGSGRRISASALKTYLNCPLEFYLSYVNGIRDDNDLTEYLDAAQLGDIFHRSAQKLYDSHSHQPITADVIDDILSSGEIDKVVFEEVCASYGLDPQKEQLHTLRPEAVFIVANIRSQIEMMLKVERENRCADGGYFRYVAGELDISDRQWKVGAHTFNFRIIIDRIDRDSSGALRFIDYKTGSDEIDAGKTLDEIFAEKSSQKRAIMQLLTYAAAYKYMYDEAVRNGETPPWLSTVGAPDDIYIQIYSMHKLMSEGRLDPITLNGAPMPPFSKISEKFYELMEPVIDGIFNDKEPFTQCKNASNCKYCHFKSICGRSVPENNY